MDRMAETEKYTLDDFYSYPEGNMTELIDGKLYDINERRPIIYQKILGKLLFELENYRLKNNPDWEVLRSVNVELNEFTAVIPDIVIVCDKNIFTDMGCSGAPDFVAEIVYNNVAHDYVRKLRLYAESGVREYWIVAPEQKK